MHGPAELRQCPFLIVNVSVTSHTAQQFVTSASFRVSDLLHSRHQPLPEHFNMQTRSHKSSLGSCRAPSQCGTAVAFKSSNSYSMRLHARRHAVRARAEAAGTHTIITGDIGGTNARLGLWKCIDAGPGKSAQQSGVQAAAVGFLLAVIPVILRLLQVVSSTLQA
jgi:hypothetical protein